MQHLLTSLNKVQQIIHLGAGRCSEMAAYLRLNPTQITLVEGDSAKAEYLQKKHLSADNIRVIPKVIAESSKTVNFYSYNLSDANSTCAPAGLLEYYPGLRLLNNQPMQSTDICLLLQQQNLQGTNNLLVIDLPGQEADILKALHCGGQLGAFEHLAIYCNQQPLYENEPCATDTQDHLIKSGYNLRQQDLNQDPDRQFNLYQLNPLHTPLQKTKQRLVALEKQSNLDQQTLIALQQQLHTQQEHTQAERQAKEQLTAERDNLQQQAAEFEQQLQAQQASTRAESQAKEQLGKECDALKAERDSAIHESQSTLQRLEHSQKERQVTECTLAQQKSLLGESQNKYAALHHKHQLLLAENTQTQQRQQQLDSELLKAQAQIELIKELMLREASF